MNTGNIKKYAPKARTRFIEAMTRQATRYGISSGHKGEGHVAPAEVRGDVLLISALDGQTHSFPKALRGPREALAKWVTQLGFEQAMEQAAYSWFNRLCAIRFMELKGYLDHGRRVLSHPDHEGGFQILDDCLEIDLPGLDTARVRELKLDGTQDEAFYRELLLAQCHALHEAMPFLFEPLDDASELLLPDNLTKTDSLIRELVEAIPEEDWQDVEVIGWLYQFYIAEKKDQVIGKVVKSEDIPAATQLFTPNWIVQYLVQNSVGRQWLQTYPDAPLKGQMPYYIEPAEQEPEVQAQLDAITPASIDPETIKVLDPACGSGHILVEAYNVLKAIYEERGYRSRDIPKLVLENNLFGLDIDDRAAQLAGFALLMKAREDDRRIFTRGVRLNVMALQSTQHLDASTLWRDLNLTGDWHLGQSQNLFEGEQKELSSNAGTDNESTYKAIVDLIERFQDAKTFGSLLEVPNSFASPLKTLLDELMELANSGDTMQKSAARQLIPIVQQAWVLAKRYDTVIANPPYMGKRFMAVGLKKFVKDNYPSSDLDLFSCMIQRGLEAANETGSIAMIVMESWMFLSTYQELRKEIVGKRTLIDLIHMPYMGKGRTPLGINFGTSAFVLTKKYFYQYKAHFSYLRYFEIDGDGVPTTFPCDNERHGHTVVDNFQKVPGAPIAYWMSDYQRKIFEIAVPLGKIAPVRQGLATADNDRFLRFWPEVSISKLGLDCDSREHARTSNKKWFPYNKGGDFRKWYGNNEFLINWENDGEELERYKPKAVIRNPGFYFKKSITWSFVSSAYFGVRFSDSHAIFDVGGSSAFPNESDAYWLTAFMCSKQSFEFMRMMNPTLNFQVGNVAELPVIESAIDEIRPRLSELGRALISIHKDDWDKFERSWCFLSNPLVEKGSILLSAAFYEYIEDSLKKVEEAGLLECEANKLLISSYGLEEYLDESLPPSQITLDINPAYRYSSANIEILDDRLKSDTLCELVSYCVGCMMGRYSLDKPGLILASQGETIQDYLAQIPEPSFTPDKNAIIPLTDQEWFPDDATNRFRDFVRTVWGEEHLQENLNFVAESLCLHAIKPPSQKSGGEAALGTIRRYLSTQFYKDHLRTYKKRPIYWLFSSGKQKAFECLVYLHRYNESTLAEMRTDYVIPLTEKLASYVEKLEKDKEASASAAEAKRIEKELSKLYKQQAELNTFDEKLRHYADQRISLDLDDGVKVNYGKFGDLLVEVR